MRLSKAKNSESYKKGLSVYETFIMVKLETIL